MSDLKGPELPLGEFLENIRELLGAIFIQEQRNYDMLMIIADKLGADANKLLKMHEVGEVLAPAPAFRFDDIGDIIDLWVHITSQKKESTQGPTAGIIKKWKRLMQRKKLFVGLRLKVFLRNLTSYNKEILANDRRR